MRVHFPEPAQTSSTLLSARHIVARPHLHDRKSLEGACGYMLMRGDHIDCVRARALKERLESDVADNRTLMEIARDVPLIDWAFGGVILVSILALYFLISVFERMTWVGVVQ